MKSSRFPAPEAKQDQNNRRFAGCRKMSPHTPLGDFPSPRSPARGEGRRSSQLFGRQLDRSKSPAPLRNRGRHQAHRPLESVGQQPVEIVLALTPRFNQARHAKQRQMMTHRRLALPQQFAQRANMQFLLLQEKMKNPEPRGVGQKFEQPDEILRRADGQCLRQRRLRRKGWSRRSLRPSHFRRCLGAISIFRNAVDIGRSTGRNAFGRPEAAMA
jgi:hypothetical protein